MFRSFDAFCNRVQLCLPFARKSLLRRQKWDRRFLQMCRSVSDWSKDPRQHVGAVIVGLDGQIVSTGYNGLPRRIRDSGKILHNRELKLRYTVHAEENAIILSRRDVSGMRLYVYPIPPCIKCAAMIIQSGITEVITVKNTGKNPKWLEEGRRAEEMFRQAGLKIRHYDPEFLDQK